MEGRVVKKRVGWEWKIVDLALLSRGDGGETATTKKGTRRETQGMTASVTVVMQWNTKSQGYAAVSVGGHREIHLLGIYFSPICPVGIDGTKQH